MVKLPILGLLADLRVLEEDRVRTHFTKAVKVELANKRRKVVVLEVLWNKFILKFLRVLHNKSQAVIRPVLRLIERRVVSAFVVVNRTKGLGDRLRYVIQFRLYEVVNNGRLRAPNKV